MIFACRAMFYACLSSRSHSSRCRWHTHLTNHSYFLLQEKPKDPFQPHAGVKMAQVLGSPLYICGCNACVLVYILIAYACHYDPVSGTKLLSGIYTPSALPVFPRGLQEFTYPILYLPHIVVVQCICSGVYFNSLCLLL